MTTTTTADIGSRVSYEDIANPYREGEIIGEWTTPATTPSGLPLPSAPNWRVRWDDGEETAVTKHLLDAAAERQARYLAEGRPRVAGWNVHPPARDRNGNALRAGLRVETPLGFGRVVSIHHHARTTDVRVQIEDGGEEGVNPEETVVVADLPGNPFDGVEVIHSYTRTDARRDGFLVPAASLVPDEPDFVRSAGWKVEVDLSRSVADLVLPSERESENGQSVKGRLWDVLSMARLYAARRDAAEVRFPCIFALAGRPDRRGGQKTIALKATIGPDDYGDPALTISLPDED